MVGPMCDCLCSLRADGALFAKNSDRPPGEAQIVEALPGRVAGGSVRTQYLTVPDTGSSAILGARPTWLWGLEHGVNASRVAIGNEQLWTVDNPADHPEALTGMDLVRLGLERGRTAAGAVDVITSFIEAFGQGGIADRDQHKAYFCSFLVADPTEAWVVETSARSWAARRVTRNEGGVALSNRIELSTDFTRASDDVVVAGDFDRWRRQSSPTAHADKRLRVTRPAANGSGGPREVAAVLRHHGERAWGRPGDDPSDVAGLPTAVIDRLGTGVSLCLHLHQVQATTSSMIAWLPADPDGLVRGWVAPGNPCVSVFVPTFGTDGVTPELAAAETWERFRRLRDRVEAARTDDGDGGAAALGRIRSVLAPVEAALWDEADELSELGDPGGEQRRAWARRAWPPIEAALVTLGV
jgi:secernin